tara:strand:+ start:1358 stop:2203 length:846 start_codon:yes stop_codon:yes gene_type:complete
MKITKKKNYYYLKHSFRKQGKVVTKERYLGKDIPKNIEDIKENFLEDIKKLELYKQLKKIKTGFQKEWKKYPESIKDKLKEQIAVAFTYNTNAIEGSTITLEETRDIIEDKISPNRPLKDIKETEAHAKLFLEILEKKENLNNKLLLKWHKELFSDTKSDIAGKFRDYSVGVGTYHAPDWQDIKKLIKGFIEFYNKNKKINPVELAARLHYKFEKIHPFGDGNGRIGRLIINYILWHSKYPMIVIEYKKRKSYYRAFEEEDKFFKYFIRRYLSVHKKYWKK